MTLDERLADAKARSVKFYLQRTKLEEQKQQLQVQAQQLANQARAVDLELYKSDCEVDLLTVLTKEANG